MTRTALTLLLTLCCALALALSLGFGPPPASAQTSVAGAGPAAYIHGLAPLPGNAEVPLYDRPPGAFSDDGGPSPVIFPPQQLTIRFNHRKHVKELKLSCTTCHDRAKTSKKSQDSLLPKPTRCDPCHMTNHRNLSTVSQDGDDVIGQCGFCHIGYKPGDGNKVARLSIPKPNLRMNHAAHARRNIGCGQCHGNVENVELATRDQLPRMRGCFGCHQMPAPARGQAKGACTTCHVTEPSGLVKTSFATGRLLPPRWLHDAGHGVDWIERHKRIAGNDSKMCSSCHSEKYCVDCHDGRVRPRKVHPNDWLNLHAVASRQNSPNCTSCHRHQSFCIGCHQRVGVALSGPYENFAGRGRFHPPKSVWTDSPRTSRHHAWEAQRNLSACVSCHTERDCAICHATARVGGRGAGTLPGFSGTGQGVNPHPAGFRSRCGAAQRQNARPCLVCHDPADPQLMECR
jgi:hypothetical protein